MPGMAGMADNSAPPVFSLRRLGYGLEMIGALGDTDQFFFDFPRQQHCVGPAFSYAVSPHWCVDVKPAFRLSGASDPFCASDGVAVFDRSLSTSAS